MGDNETSARSPGRRSMSAARATSRRELAKQRLEQARSPTSTGRPGVEQESEDRAQETKNASSFP